MTEMREKIEGLKGYEPYLDMNFYGHTSADMAGDPRGEYVKRSDVLALLSQSSPSGGGMWQPMSIDGARLALRQAIGSIKIGNKTDDKLILDELRKQGVWLYCVSDEQPKAEATNVAEPAGCQRGGAAETPSNQSLQEGMVLVPREPTKEIASRRFGSEHDKPCRDPRVLTCARWECQRANECQDRAPSSISQEQEKGV